MSILNMIIYAYLLTSQKSSSRENENLQVNKKRHDNMVIGENVSIYLSESYYFDILLISPLSKNIIS